MSYLSDFQNSSSILQAKAGPLAIAINDLLLATYAGQVYPAQTVPYAVGSAGVSGGSNAGNFTVPATTITASQYASSEVRQSSYVNPLDNTMYCVGPHLGSNSGIKVSRFSPIGTPLSSVVLETTAATGVGGVNIVPLSNGNLAVVWLLASSYYYFAIIDPTLNIVVGRTQLSPGGVTASAAHVCPLSGGGFASLVMLSAGINLVICSNTGAFVLAATAIAGCPANYPFGKVAQLSNGNLAVVIASTTAGKALGQCIFTPAGVPVLAYTVLDASTKAAQGWPDISVLPGTYAVAGVVNPAVNGYVLNNAGALQGAAFTDTGSSGVVKMMNDGVNFWLMYTQTSANMVAAFMPVTGSNYVITYTNLGSPQSFDAFVDRGFLVFVSAAVTYVFSIKSNNMLGFVTSFASAVGSSSDYILRPVGDFTAMLYAPSAGQAFAVFKYLDCAIVGVSRAAVAAGNTGALVQYVMGAGGFSINPLTGQTSRAFDHSGANVVGNKGTLMQNSVTLKGI